MSRNLNRLNAYANRLAATQDFNFVYHQALKLGFRPFFILDLNKSAKKIDKYTRIVIEWAKENNKQIVLPDDWEL